MLSSRACARSGGAWVAKACLGGRNTLLVRDSASDTTAMLMKSIPRALEEDRLG
jgi:hypothetical protein